MLSLFEWDDGAAYEESCGDFGGNIEACRLLEDGEEDSMLCHLRGGVLSDFFLFSSGFGGFGNAYFRAMERWPKNI